jgi:indolepyruvate ferredoxin oxidoreductase, alpha subunit
VEDEHIRIMNPLRKHHEENTKLIADELAYEGVSVIISQRECIQTASRRLRKNKGN